MSIYSMLLFEKSVLPSAEGKQSKAIFMSDYIQVLTTTQHRNDAEAIARALVEGRLAACVQIVGPVTSIFRWQGKIETAEEWQCWAKTRRDLYQRIEAAILRLHPYKVPEILALEVLAGGADYFAWLDEELGDRGWGE